MWEGTACASPLVRAGECVLAATSLAATSVACSLQPAAFHAVCSPAANSLPASGLAGSLQPRCQQPCSKQPCSQQFVSGLHPCTLDSSPVACMFSTCICKLRLHSSRIPFLAQGHTSGYQGLSHFRVPGAVRTRFCSHRSGYQGRSAPGKTHPRQLWNVFWNVLQVL